MDRFRIYEEPMNEYSFAEVQKPTLLFEVDAEDHDEAYREFVAKHPTKARSPVTVHCGRIAVEYGRD